MGIVRHPMNIPFKAQLSKATLWLLLVLSSLFVIAIVILTLCSGLGLNPFLEGTTVLLVSLFVGILGLGMMALLLNVAANLSLISEVHLSRSAIAAGPSHFKRWLYGTLALCLLAIVTVTTGSFYSEKAFLKTVRNQAEAIVGDNRKTIDKIGALLAKDTPESYREIASLVKFLESQRKDLPRVVVIHFKPFEDKMSYQSITSYLLNTDIGIGLPQPITSSEVNYFECTEDKDCDFLKSFSEGKTVSPLEWHSQGKNDFVIYFPMEASGVRFVLLFSQYTSYGKLGSM